MWMVVVIAVMVLVAVVAPVMVAAAAAVPGVTKGHMPNASMSRQYAVFHVRIIHPPTAFPSPPLYLSLIYIYLIFNGLLGSRAESI